MQHTTHQPQPNSNNEKEQGQVLVIAVGMLCALAIAMLFYLNVQRAYNLANFLDETAELAAQAAAEPKADALLDGDIIIDSSQALTATKAAIFYSAEANGADLSGRETDLTCQMETGSARGTDCPGGSLTVLNPGDTGCDDYNPTGETECFFPVVIVRLTLPYTLFGITFDIGAQGVAVVGDNTQDNTVTIDPTPIPNPTIDFPDIIITPSS